MDRGWNRSSCFFSLVFLFILLLGAPSGPCAEPLSNPELEAILQKIESRHYRWIAIRADVLLFFAKDGDPNAMCGGELLYQRLDERMFLTCADTRDELMFIFRTFDRRFDLYLPSQNTVYHGSIFDLEDSPDIESHLKARDLYRALKPITMDPKRTQIERANSAITSLDVYGRDENQTLLERKLYLTPEGDVRGELFFNTKGKPVTEIQRYDFREVQGHVGSYDSAIFPKKITIVSPETKKGSAIFFSKIKALDAVDPLDFILRVPPGTKEIFLDEKDSRFQSLKASENAPRLNAKTVRSHLPKIASTPPAGLSAKTIPVYLAKPLPTSLKKSEEKTIPPPTAEKKELVPSQEAIVAPALPLPANTDVSQDADLPVNPETSSDQPSQTDRQTTLDPSVEPSLDMGKQ